MFQPVGASDVSAIAPVRWDVIADRAVIPWSPNGGVVIVDADAITADDLSTAREWLDVGERRRAAAFVRDDDRRMYVIAHAALRRVVGAVLGVSPQHVVIDRDRCPRCGKRHGRPIVSGSSVHVSLSHTSGLAAVAIASTPVGVDVEWIPASVDDAPLMALHPRERSEIAAMPRDARPAAFARAWTRSEAYLKGLGVGLAREPSLDDVGADPVPRRRGPGWEIGDLAVPPGYVGACAVAGHIPREWAAFRRSAAGQAD